MDGMGKSGSGFDVTKSLPSSTNSLRRGQTPSGMSVTKAQVTQSLREHLRPARGGKALEDYDVTHSLDPDLQLSAKFAGREQSELDDEVFYSLKNNPEITDSPAGPFNLEEVDVTQGLSRAFVMQMTQKPEGLLSSSAQILPDADNDDAQFYSATNKMFEGYSDEFVQKKLEQSVAMSLMPGAGNDIQQTTSQKIEKAWVDLTEKLANGDPEEVKAALLGLTSQYPAVSNPAKVADMLETYIQQSSSSEDGVANCRQLMGKFQLAGELTVDDLSGLDQLSNHDAIQVLMIMRQKAVNDGADVDELEKVIQERLIKDHGEKVEAFIGFNIDEKNPDYEQYRQLQETIGMASQAEPRWHEKSSYVNKNRDIPIDPNDQPVQQEMSDEPVMPRSIEGAISNRLLKHAMKKPGDALSELIKLDSWLADDPTQEIAVTNLISRQYSEELKKKSIALGLYNEINDQSESDTELTPSSSPVNNEPQDAKAKKRVRFEDQPEVLPRDNFSKSDEERVRVNDIVELSRESASLEIRTYVDRLTNHMRWLEVDAHKAQDHAYKNNGEYTKEGVEIINKISGYRDTAEKYRKLEAKIQKLQREYHQLLREKNRPQSLLVRQKKRAIQEKQAESLTMRMELLAAFDKEIVDGNGQEQRWERFSEQSFIKSGLVDKNELFSFLEDQLAKMAMQTVDVAMSKALPGEPTYKLEPSDQPSEYGRSYKIDTNGDKSVPQYLVPGRRRRGAPSTADIMRAVNSASRPYIQATEINLENPVSFCADIADVKDPRVMLALKVRMEKEKCPKAMNDNWDKRMKDVMREYQVKQILSCFDVEITSELNERHEMISHGIPKYPEIYDKDAQKLTMSYGQQIIKEIEKGEMSYPGITNDTNAGMQQIWNCMEKPATMPKDVNQLLVNYMPEPHEILSELESEGIIERKPKKTAAPKQPVENTTKTEPQQPVSSADKPAEENEGGFYGWVKSWWS